MREGPRNSTECTGLIPCESELPWAIPNIFYASFSSYKFINIEREIRWHSLQELIFANYLQQHLLHSSTLVKKLQPAAGEDHLVFLWVQVGQLLMFSCPGLTGIAISSGLSSSLGFSFVNTREGGACCSPVLRTHVTASWKSGALRNNVFYIMWFGSSGSATEEMDVTHRGVQQPKLSPLHSSAPWYHCFCCCWWWYWYWGWDLRFCAC